MRGRVIAGVVSLLLVGVTPAVATTDLPEVPKFQKQEQAYQAFQKLYAKAEASKKVYAGRNVAKHGRAKDGKISHALVRERARELWLEFHPELKQELEFRKRMEAFMPGFKGAYYRHQSHLESIASCESGGEPTTNTGNGYYGKYQFSYSTWVAIGGPSIGVPSDYDEAIQDHFAGINYEVSNPYGQWPVCAYR